MKCLRVAFVLSALLLASSAWGENMSPEWKEMKEVVDRCLDFFGKTTDDMKNIFKNGTLDESTDFPAEMMVCTLRGLHVFNDEDNDKFSLSALLRFMTAGLSRKGSEVIVKHIATFADECGRKSESSPLPVLEKAKFLINCLLSQDWSSVVSDEDDDENERTPSPCETSCTEICALKCRSANSVKDEASSQDCTLKCSASCHHTCKTADTENQSNPTA